MDAALIQEEIATQAWNFRNGKSQPDFRCKLWIAGIYNLELIIAFALRIGSKLPEWQWRSFEPWRLREQRVKRKGQFIITDNTQYLWGQLSLTNQLSYIALDFLDRFCVLLRIPSHVSWFVTNDVRTPTRSQLIFRGCLKDSSALTSTRSSSLSCWGISHFTGVRSYSAYSAFLAWTFENSVSSHLCFWQLSVYIIKVWLLALFLGRKFCERKQKVFRYQQSTEQKNEHGTTV